MIAFEKRNDLVPRCPHCKKEIKRVAYRECKGDLGKRCLYFCGECQTCLGFSHRKGLTFGW
jgi:hypothetical protein